MLKNIKNWLIKHYKKIRIILFLYFCILTWLLLRAPQGNKQLLKYIPIFNDKLIHTISFIGLSFLAKIVYPQKNQLQIISIGTCYGILIEFLQEYMKLGRTFEYFDMVADCIGCIIGSYIAKKITVN
jgi:VanZ family protein